MSRTSGSRLASGRFAAVRDQVIDRAEPAQRAGGELDEQGTVALVGAGACAAAPWRPAGRPGRRRPPAARAGRRPRAGQSCRAGCRRERAAGEKLARGHRRACPRAAVRGCGARRSPVATRIASPAASTIVRRHDPRNRSSGSDPPRNAAKRPSVAPGLQSRRQASHRPASCGRRSAGRRRARWTRAATG